MLQNKFEMPLDLHVKPSKILRFYFLTLLFLSITSIFYTGLDFYIQLFLLGLLGGYSNFVYRKYNSSQVTLLKLNSEDEWRVKENNIDSVKAELMGECIVTRFMVWLNFRVKNSLGREKVIRILLLPDSIETDHFRKLRARLRFLKNKTEESELEYKVNKQ
ncbi:MAG: hypothetical protein QM484_06490 [Woeseiaceae bacterium]